MTALEFANSHENVIVRYVSQGAPAGQDIALLPETELPFDLEAIEGEVGLDGQFSATNLTTGPGPWDFKFRDWNRNCIYGLWLRVDANKWQAEYQDHIEGS